LNRVLEIRGIEIAVNEIGQGTPLLVIHGWSADHRYMAADIEPNFSPASSWKRVYFDLPGHGTTIAPSWLQTQSQMIEIVVELIEQVVGQEKFAVIGNSYGGYLGLALVRTMPRRLLGVALVVPDLPDETNLREVPEKITLRSDPSLFHDLEPDEEWIPSGLVEHSTDALNQIRLTDMPAYRVADYEFLARLNEQYVLPPELRVATDPFEQPSLIALGRQDSTVGFARQLGLMGEFPRATFAVVDFAGHYLGRVERPRVYNALIADWIERMDLESR
jgi:pimeloyl-ACP methyl ester carboxylesterase